MIKRFFIMVCCAISLSTVYACDACSASSFGIGLMTDYRSNFVRLSYFDTHFKSSSDHGHYNSSDVFAQMDVSFRYSLASLPKLRFVGQIPYGYNRRTSNDDEYTEQGLSDIKLLLNYALFNGTAENMKTSFYLEAGGGLSLPTGKYDANIRNENLPENFNIGKGALAYLFQMNAVLSHDKFGLLINNNYQLNNRTNEGYHFGNQYSSQLTAFREFPVGNFKVIPNLGVLYEKIASDEYENGNNVPETGGNGLFLSSAINFKTDKWLAGVSYSLPIDQNYSNGVIDTGRKLAVHLSFLF